MWLDVPGVPGIAASDDGWILNTTKGRIKKQSRASNGALKVDVNGKTYLVHDLVARAFYGEPMTRGFRVKHRNGDRSDNQPDNLIWAGAAVFEPYDPTEFDIQLEHEYEKARTERLSLIELMQS